MIFNIFAGVEVLLVAIPAAVVGAAASYLGFDGEFGFMLVAVPPGVAAAFPTARR